MLETFLCCEEQVCFRQNLDARKWPWEIPFKGGTDTLKDALKGGGDSKSDGDQAMKCEFMQGYMNSRSSFTIEPIERPFSLHLEFSNDTLRWEQRLTDSEPGIERSTFLPLATIIGAILCVLVVCCGFRLNRRPKKKTDFARVLADIYVHDYILRRTQSHK